MLQAQNDVIAGALGADVAAALAPVPGGQAALSADGAVPITQDLMALCTKGSAGAYSVAAPGAANIGRVLDFINTTAFAHVFTFTGGTIRGGVAGVTTATMAALPGARLKVRAISATVWTVEIQVTCPLT